MKCPLRLRGISIPGGRPGSDAGGSGSGSSDLREAKSGHAADSYAATDCEAGALFFPCLKTGIAWSFLDMTGISMWAGETQERTHTLTPTWASNIFPYIHIYSHAHMCLNCTLSTHTHLSALLSISLDVTHSLLGNPICPNLCRSVSSIHSVL